MSKKAYQDFLLTIDGLGIIVNIIPSGSIFKDYMNQHVTSMVSEDYQLRFTDFYNQLKKEYIVVNFEMSIHHHELIDSCFFNGFKDENNTFIVISHDNMTENDILKKIMSLNSKQINEIRTLRKDFQLQDTRAYEEITKLNSELLNSKRIIEKQNAELLNYNKLLKKMSAEDSLTGCYNRRYFYDFFREHIIASQKDTLYSFVMIDFNRFKAVNDQFGHDAGDRLLVTFVQLAKQAILDKGDIFRLGGDEFILLIQRDYQHSFDLMENLNKEFLKHSTVVSLAFGIVTFKALEINHEFDLTNLLRKSDELMYEHKRNYYK